MHDNGLSALRQAGRQARDTPALIQHLRRVPAKQGHSSPPATHASVLLSLPPSPVSWSTNSAST